MKKYQGDLNTALRPVIGHFWKLQRTVSKEDSNTEACCRGCCKNASQRTRPQGRPALYRFLMITCGHFWELQRKVLKRIQILRPVAESVAKMLGGRGRGGRPAHTSAP